MTERQHFIVLADRGTIGVEVTVFRQPTVNDRIGRSRR
jgi:hypothetical protein